MPHTKESGKHFLEIKGLMTGGIFAGVDQNHFVVQLQKSFRENWNVICLLQKSLKESPKIKIFGLPGWSVKFNV